jgi:hypothetical protein
MLGRQEIDNLYRLIKFEVAWTTPPLGMIDPLLAQLAS